MSTVIYVVWLLLKPIALFLICLTFLYEDEEGRVQDRIREWWIRLDDVRTISISWAAAFMQRTARLAERAIYFIFGTKLLSFRLLGTSFYFSIASIQLITGFTPGHPGQWPPITMPFHLANLFQALLLFFIVAPDKRITQ
ncbi:MAG: hypothetical protein WCA21_06125 [Terracidiphilus sp.]